MLLPLAATTLCRCCSAACTLCCVCPVIREAGWRVCIPVVVSPPGQGVCSIVVGRLLQLIALGDMDEVHLGSNVLFTKLVHSEVPVSCAHHLWPCTSIPFSCVLVATLFKGSCSGLTAVCSAVQQLPALWPGGLHMRHATKNGIHIQVLCVMQQVGAWVESLGDTKALGWHQYGGQHNQETTAAAQPGKLLSLYAHNCSQSIQAIHFHCLNLTCVFGTSLQHHSGLQQDCSAKLLCMSCMWLMPSRWGQGLTLMQARGVGPGVAQPHIKALIKGCKRLGACDAVGHPAHGGVQNAMHEEDHIPSACRPYNSLLRNATIACHNMISWWPERVGEVTKPGKCTDAMRRSMPTLQFRGQLFLRRLCI